MARLELSPDRREAVPLALTRIKANGVAAGICALCLGLLPASYPVIGLALVSTIGLCCYLGRLMSGCRSALAALIIIMLHDPLLSRAAVWQAAGQRLASVVIGGGVALLITLVFHRRYAIRSYALLDPTIPTRKASRAVWSNIFLVS